VLTPELSRTGLQPWQVKIIRTCTRPRLGRHASKDERSRLLSTGLIGGGVRGFRGHKTNTNAAPEKMPMMSAAGAQMTADIPYTELASPVK
jgi:hypothetical protein